MTDRPDRDRATFFYRARRRDRIRKRLEQAEGGRGISFFDKETPAIAGKPQNNIEPPRINPRGNKDNCDE